MSLAKLPDVLGSERIEQDADELTQDVLTVFAEACDGFDQMRGREGEKLAEDVRNHASVIETLVGEVEKRSPERVAEYREKLLGKTGQVTRYERLGLFLFVAIPLPGTGAWSGALIATLLKMPKTKALTSILCGVIVAGFIMLLGSQGVIGVAHLF